MSFGHFKLQLSASKLFPLPLSLVRTLLPALRRMWTVVPSRSLFISHASLFLYSHWLCHRNSSLPAELSYNCVFLDINLNLPTVSNKNKRIKSLFDCFGRTWDYFSGGTFAFKAWFKLTKYVSVSFVRLSFLPNRSYSDNGRTILANEQESQDSLGPLWGCLHRAVWGTFEMVWFSTATVNWSDLLMRIIWIFSYDPASSLTLLHVWWCCLG